MFGRRICTQKALRSDLKQSKYTLRFQQYNHLQNVTVATGLYWGRELLPPMASFFLRPAVRTSAPTTG